MTGQESAPPIRIFMPTASASPLTISEVLHERTINIRVLQEKMDKLHPIVNRSVQDNRDKSREARSTGQLPNFDEGDYILVAREDFHAFEKLSLRWRGPRRITKAINSYVYQVYDFRNG